MTTKHAATVWTEVLAGHVARQPSRVAWIHADGDAWSELSYAEVDRRVRRFARALLARGFGRGEVVSVLSANRWQWGVTDLGTMHAGGICTGVYPTNSAEQCAFILDHSETRFVVCDSREQVEKILGIAERLPKLEAIISLEPGVKHARVVAWDDFMAEGDAKRDELDAALDERIRAVRPDDVMMYVYTSGTTGNPKCVQLTHANLLRGMQAVIDDYQAGPEDVVLSYLPAAHAADRVGVFFAALLLGGSLGYLARIEALPEALARVRPTLLLVVPRVLEKIAAKLDAGLATAPGYKQKLFHWAVGVGKRASRHRRRGEAVPAHLGLQHALATRLVFRPFKERVFGGRLRYFVSGAAPLAKSLAELFDALGIPVYEAWAMSETAAIGTSNRPGAVRYGSVGKPVPVMDIKLDEDGEILIRGPSVMSGYYKNDAANQESFTPEGYFRTGDIGRFDDDGYLYITDRKKDLLITSSGKNVAPQNIENLLKQSRFVSMAMAVGDRRNFVTALVTLDPETVSEHLAGKGLGDLPREKWPEHPEVLGLVQAAVDEANRTLSRIESVRKFAILPGDFSIDAGEITPTLKLRRNVVTAKYAEVIEELYRS